MQSDNSLVNRRTSPLLLAIIKRAVKEFAENAIKPIIDELVELLYSNNEIYIETGKSSWKHKLDRLIKELYSGEE